MPEIKDLFAEKRKEIDKKVKGYQTVPVQTPIPKIKTEPIEQQQIEQEIEQQPVPTKPPQKTEAPLSDYDIIKQRREAAIKEISAFEQHRQRLNELDKTTPVPKEQYEYEYKGVTEGEYGAYIGQQKEKEKEAQRVEQGIKAQGIEFIKQERLKKQYEEQQKIKDLQQNLNPDIDKKIKEYEEKQPSYFDQFSLIHKRAKDEDEQLHYDVVSELYDNDRRNYDIAKTVLQDTKSLLNAPTKTEGGGFGKAASNEIKQLDTWLTISGLGDNLQKSSVVKFAQTGKPLTKSEESLLDAIFDYYYVSNERAGNISKAYAAGQMAGKSIPFMLDFIMTGGFASGATGGFGKAMAKRVEAKLIEKFGEAAYKKLTKTGVDRLIKAPFKAAEELTAGAMQAPMTPTFYSSVTEELMPKPIEKKEGGGYVYQQGTPIKVAVIRGMNEVIFERSGEFIGDVFSPLGKALAYKNYFNKIKSTKLKDFNRVLYGGNGTFAETLKKTGFNGIPLEMGEEVLGQLANYVTGASTKEEMDEFFSKDNFQTMLMGFAPMTGVSVAGNMAQRVMINNNHKKATANINNDFGDKAQDVISSLNETSPDRLQDIFDEIMLNNDGYEGNKLTDKGKVMANDMLRYVYTKAQVESVKGIDQDNYKATGAPKNAVNEMQDGKHTVALLDAQGNIIVQKQFENEDAAEKYKQKLNEMYMTPNNEVDKQINEGLNTLSQQTVTKLNALKSNQKNTNGEDIIITSVVEGLSNDAIGVPNGTEVYIKADNGKQSIVQYVDNNELKKAVIPNENLTNKTEELVSDMFFQYMDIASKTMYKTSAQSNQLIMEGLAEEDNMTTHDYSNKKAGHKIKYDGKEAVIQSVDTDNDGNKYADIELEDGAIVKAVPLRSVKNPKTVTFNIGKQQIELSKSNETGYFQTDILSKEKAETVKNGIQINSDYIAEIKEQPNPANPIEKGYRVTVREKTEEEKQDKNSILNALITDIQENGLYVRDKEGGIQIINANEIDVNELSDKGELRLTDKETGLSFVIPLENQQNLRAEYKQLQQQPEKVELEVKPEEKPITEAKPEIKVPITEPTYTELFEQTKGQYGYDTAIQDIKDEISSKETQLSNINETIKSASMKEKAVLRGQAQAINIELTELNNILKTQSDIPKGTLQIEKTEQKAQAETNKIEILETINYRGTTINKIENIFYEPNQKIGEEFNEDFLYVSNGFISALESGLIPIKTISILDKNKKGEWHHLFSKNEDGTFDTKYVKFNEEDTEDAIKERNVEESNLAEYKGRDEGRETAETSRSDSYEQGGQEQAETSSSEKPNTQQAELKPTGEQLSLFSTTSLDQSLTDLSSEERVKIVQDAIEQINDGKKVIIIDDMFSHLETKFKDNKVILERINNLRKINGDVIGYTIGNEITLNSNQATINKCIAAFEHERQHVENKEDKAWNDIKNDIAENIDNETLQKEVSALSGNSFYEGLSNNVLADEYIAYVIQKTFEGKEIKSSLKYKNIIQDEYRKRNGERLSILGRGTYPNIDAERRIGQNIVDNETGENRFLGSVSEGQEREVNEYRRQNTPDSREIEGTPIYGISDIRQNGEGQFDNGRGIELNTARDTEKSDVSTYPFQTNRAEIERIISEAKESNTYLKAPNGNPTKLNENQWVQVRTKAFKDWFGDWENANKPYREVFQERHVAFQDLKNNGLHRAKFNSSDGSITVYHGTSKDAEGKIFNNGFNDSTYFSINKNGTTNGDSPLDVAKRKFGKDATVMEIKIDPRDIELAAGGSELYSPYRLVKGEDGVYSKEVNASKVVDENGEPLVVYHETNADWNIYDKSKLKAGKFDYMTPNGIFLKSSDTKIGLGDKQMGLYANIKNPIYARDRESLESFFRLNIEGYSELVDQINKTDKEYGKRVSDEQKISADKFVEEREKFKGEIPSPEWSAIVEENNKETDRILSEWIDKIDELSLKAKDLLNSYIENSEYDGIFLLHDKGSFGRETDATIALNPTQIKSATENIGTFDSENEDIRFATAPTSDIGFYSTVENALLKIKQDKGTKEQFKVMLLNNGAKQAELDWMGFDELPEKLTKTDIQKWIDSNKVEVEEVEKGLDALEWEQFGNTYKYGDYEIEKSNTSGKYVVYHYGSLGSYMSLDGAKKFVEAQLSVGEKRRLTKYDQYQLPGGKNYRELLLTMPTDLELYSLVDVQTDKVIETSNDYEALIDKKIELGGKLVVIENEKSKGKTFKSIHFDESNILAHVRFNERTDKNGDKVLFIEELQSDWAQKGKKEGFKTNLNTWNDQLGKDAVSAIKDMGNLGFDTWQQAASEIEKNPNYETEFDIDDQYKPLISDWRKAVIQKRKEGNSVPSMPFSKTDQWVNLAARRMMRYAAENGFDRIAWTNGEQQADRYKLSKQVDSIGYIDNNNGTYILIGYKDNEPNRIGNNIGKDKLEDYVGKEIANKIINKEGRQIRGGDLYILEGNDLKVGGEGMKGFYDNIVPNTMNKLGKPFNSKVETIEIEEIGQQQSIPITKEMKESVLEGIPLFAINLSPQQRKLVDMLNEISISEDVENAEESTNYRKAYIERYKALKDKLNAKNPNIVEIYQDVLKYLEALANDKTWSKWDKSAKPQLISIRNSVRELKKAGSIYGLKKKLEKALDIVLERQNETARKIIDNFVNQKLEGKKGKGVIIPKKVDAITRQFFDSMKEWMNKDSQSIENKLQNLRVAFNQKKEGNERDIIESQIKALTYIQNYKENITKQEDTISNIIIDINRLSKEYILKDIRKDISSKYNTIASNKKKLDEVDERGKVDIIEANINLKKEIEAKQNEYKSIKQDIKLNKSDKAQLTGLKSLLLEERISMQNSMESFIKELDTVLKEGIKAKRIFAAKEEAKKQEILKGVYLEFAMSETEIIVNPRLEESKKSILHRWLDPKYTFSSMLKDFGIYAPDGKGILYERFFTNGMLVARQKELTGLKEITKAVDEKITGIFGKENHILQVQKLCNDFNGAYVTIKTTVNKLNTESGKTESSVQEQIMELRNGQALYIYAIAKMNDGIVKLNAMGIDQEQIDSVTATLDPKLIEFIDWAQDEYLPLLREKYNITHLDLFGSQLDQIDNYFPLNIDLSGIPKEIDIEDTKTFKGLPTTATGAILKRTYNKYGVDIQNSDAIETFIEHIQTMEKWNAYAPVIKELNILNSDNTFKKYVNRYIFNGAANQFKDMCAIAVGAYVPQESTVGSILTTATKMYAISKISGRANTSLKQGLGMVQVLGEGNLEFTARVFKNFADPLCLKWALDNLPLFEERWNGRTGGDDRLSLEGELSFIKSKKIVALMNKASNIGMLPNAAIDLFVSGVMAKSMYEAKYNFYKNKRGYSEEESISKALKDAETIYNETQQSAENLWLSKTQKDRTFLSASFSLFNNANFAYGRLFFEGLSTVGKQIKPKGRANLIAFQKARYIAEGRTPEVASKYAKNDVNRALSKGIMQIGLNGYFVQFVWNLASDIGIMKALQYIMVFMSDDDKEREIAFEELKDDIKSSAIKAVITPVRGLPGGKELESALELYLNGWTLKQISIQSNPLISDTKQAFEGMANGFKDNDWVKIINSLVRYSSGFTGVDLNTIANITYGIYDLIENHENITTTDVLYDLSLIINSPKSEQKFLAVSRRDDDTFEDIVNRYIELKRVHQYGAFSPLTKKEDSRAVQEVAKMINVRYYTLKEMLNEYDKAVETYNKFNPDNYIDLYQNASYERASTLKAELEYTAKTEMLDENQMNELKTAIEAMENDESLNEIYKNIKRAAWSNSRKKEPELE